MNTDSATLARLADVLAGLYADKASVRRVVTDAKLDAGIIDFDQGVVFIWYNILRTFSHKAEALYQVAIQEHSNNAQLEGLLKPEPSQTEADLSSIVAKHSSIIPMYFYDLALERAKSVALIDFKDTGAMSTGFLIANNLLVTAYFVIPSAKDASQARIRLNFEQDPSGKAETSHQLKLKPQQFFFSSAEVGLTAVRVEGKVNQRWGALEFNPNPPAVGDVVTLIQHPFGKYKSASSGALSSAGEGQLDYLCETAPGSSGAPVFDQNWKVVGMHLGRNEHGGKYGVSAKAMIKALGL